VTAVTEWTFPAADVPGARPTKVELAVDRAAGVEPESTDV